MDLDPVFPTPPPLRRRRASSIGSGHVTENPLDRQHASPLFAKLPPELRAIIFTELFGKRRVHLAFMQHPIHADKVGTRRRWRHAICEIELETPFRNVVAHQHFCLGAAHRMALDISMLFTCRRGLAESIPVLYHSNTFLLNNVHGRKLPVDDIRSLQAKIPRHWPLIHSLEIKWELTPFDRNHARMVPHDGGRNDYEGFWDALADMPALKRLRIAILMPRYPRDEFEPLVPRLPALYLDPIERLKQLQVCEVILPTSFLSAFPAEEWDLYLSRIDKDQHFISWVDDNEPQPRPAQPVSVAAALASA